MYGTALEEAVSFHEISAKEHFALLLGNEGEGVSQQLLAQTTQVHILLFNITFIIYDFHLKGQPFK